MTFTSCCKVKFLCTSSFAHMFTYIIPLITHIRILSPIFAHAHIVKSFSMSSISRLLSTRFHVIGSNQNFVLTLYVRWLVTRRARARWLCRKRRSAPVRTASESRLRQWQTQLTGRAHSGSGSLRLRGSHSSSYVAQDVLRQLRPHLSPAHVHGLEVVALRGEQAMHSSTPTVRLRQVVRTVMRSCPRLSCLISGAYQDLESRD